MTPFEVFVIGSLIGYLIVTGKLAKYTETIIDAINSIKEKYG